MKERRDWRGTAPSEQQMLSSLSTVRQMLVRVEREYRWVYRAATDRTVAETVKVAASRSDPTGDLVASASKNEMRRACAKAHEKVLDAKARLLAAEELLLITLDRTDPKERPELLRYPITVSEADKREAREAKARRAARGEDFGDG